MNGPVVDLARVRNALAELDRLVAENPERCNGNGPKWADHLPELDKLTMGTPVKQRIKDYRARLREKGYKASTVYLSAATHERLLRLSQQGGLNYGDLIGLALEHLETDPSGQPLALEDATDRAALALADTGDFEDWNAVRTRPGQPVDDDDDAYWAAEADAALDRLARGEDSVIPLDEWEARHGLGG